jgi:hypothetical protein
MGKLQSLPKLYLETPKAEKSTGRVASRRKGNIQTDIKMNRMRI